MSRSQNLLDYNKFWPDMITCMNVNCIGLFNYIANYNNKDLYNILLFSEYVADFSYSIQEIICYTAAFYLSLKIIRMRTLKVLTVICASLLFHFTHLVYTIFKISKINVLLLYFSFFGTKFIFIALILIFLVSQLFNYNSIYIFY